MNGKQALQTDRLHDINGKFLVLFMLYLGLMVGIAQVPQSLYETASQITSAAVAAFWGLFRIPVLSSGSHVTFYDFPMEIIFECTGLHYAGIFAAAVLAYRGRTISNKAAGLFIGISAIFLLNILRLGMLGMVGHYLAGLFTFVHLYLWHALFTIVVLMLWVLWVNGKIGFTPPLSRQALIVAAAATLSFWIFFTFLGSYYSFLASLADILFPLLSSAFSVPGAVIVRGEHIGYVSGEYVIYSTTGLYALNFSVFIALATISAARSRDWPLFFKQCSVGTGLMIVSHLLLMVMDWSLEVTSSELLNSILRWGIVLSSMIAPVLSWLAGVMLFRPGHVRRS